MSHIKASTLQALIVWNNSSIDKTEKYFLLQQCKVDIQGVKEQSGNNHMNSKEADLLEREDTSEKVKYDQYAVFAMT